MGEQMKKLAFTIGALLAMAAPALAGDPTPNTLVPGPLVAQMPMAPMGYNWTGLYIGANGGWVDSDSNRILNTGTDMSVGGLGTGITTGAIPSFVNLGYSGWQVGGTAGYNWQVAPTWVAGIELDADYVGDASSHATVGPITVPGHVPQTTTYGRSLDVLTTARARVGYLAMPNLLLFVTGGIAVGETQLSSAFICPTCAPAAPSAAAGPTSQSHQTFNAGPAGGGGIEWMVLPNWSIKAEYIYANLSSSSTGIIYNYGGFGPPSSTMRSTVNNAVQTARVGINYHFAPPPPPPPEMPPAPPPPPQRISFIVFFDWDKDLITHEGMDVVRKAADAYRSGGMVQIQVTGYTDRSGSAGYNQRLSERRANNVAKALAGLGVPPNQMAVSGRGENDNRVPTADGVREPQNRRVEIGWP
jgi:outer membrane protein OmpA-like peptidoglycan-associated protein